MREVKCVLPVSNLNPKCGVQALPPLLHYRMEFIMTTCTCLDWQFNRKTCCFSNHDTSMFLLFSFLSSYRLIVAKNLIIGAGLTFEGGNQRWFLPLLCLLISSDRSL